MNKIILFPFSVHSVYSDVNQDDIHCTSRAQGVFTVETTVKCHKGSKALLQPNVTIFNDRKLTVVDNVCVGNQNKRSK